MKFLSFILSVYILSLAISPCADNDCVNNFGDNNTYIQCDHSQNSQHQNDICNPLCVCFCCGSITLISTSTSNFIAQTTLNNKNNYYYQNSLSSPSFSIWQPPKI